MNTPALIALIAVAGFVLVLIALTWPLSRWRAWRDGRVAAADRADRGVRFHKANVEGGKRL